MNYTALFSGRTISVGNFFFNCNCHQLLRFLLHIHSDAHVLNFFVPLQYTYKMKENNVMHFLIMLTTMLTSLKIFTFCEKMPPFYYFFIFCKRSLYQRRIKKRKPYTVVYKHLLCQVVRLLILYLTPSVLKSLLYTISYNDILNVRKIWKV